MAAYSALTADQQALVQTFANYVRSQAILLAQLGNHGRAVANSYSGNLESILALVDNAEVIPNTTGLAGAQGMAKSDLVNLIGYLMTISDTTDNAAGSINTNFHRGLYAKACGTANLIG